MSLIHKEVVATNKPTMESLDKIGYKYLLGKRIWVTGHLGMLGSAVVRSLKNLNIKILTTTRSQLDLTNQADVYQWMNENKPELIFHIGAKVGGIHANATLPADFIKENILIETNVIDGAYRCGATKLLFVASNCTYPKNAPQPIKEEELLTGPLDESVRAYAVSKIAGIEMCRSYRKQHKKDFFSIIPPNLYGPGDNYHPDHSHVVAGILRRTHEAKVLNQREVIVWGDGSPRRELLHVDDLAQAMLWLMCSTTNYDLYNVGNGHDHTISELAAMISDIVGYEGAITFDSSKPNGAMRKLLDSSKIRALGWRPMIHEKDGLRQAYHDFLERQIASIETSSNASKRQACSQK